jgi:diaminohydroxyphosphoribosylaminopyrimidine deaminase / 5-amino-6-(5-phosphoribosylamino)uracil reductase
MEKPSPMPESSPTSHMRLAIEQMRKSTGRGPKVGAVLVSNHEVVGVGHKQAGIHAERAAIEAALAAGRSLSEATLYTTLEPCVSVGSQREPCAKLISRVGIRNVYVGRYDPNPQIYREGWRALRDAGVQLHDFETELRTEIDAINQEFIEHFVAGTGPSGGAKFDYQLNGGRFEIQFSEDDDRSITTQWTNRGAGSIYAYAVQPLRVALARYAAEFAEIDDPLALDFTYTVPVNVGEIAVFVSDVGSVLVKVLEVSAGGASGAAQRFLRIQYEVRAR